MSATTFDARVLDPRTNLISVEVVDAESVDDARASLSQRGLTPLAVTPRSRSLKLALPGRSRRVKAEDLAVFARMFATMFAASMPVVKSLTVLTRATENATLKVVLEKVAVSVQAGKPLSEAFGEHPQVFPPLMVNLIKAGEVGGFLDTALIQVADSTEKDLRLRNEIKAAATYPIVVMVIGVLATIGMLLFIVPIFTGMFTDLGGTLPLPTRIVVKMSDALKVGALPSVPFIAAGVWWWRRNKNTAAVREFIDPIKLRLPVFGPLMKEIAIARFARYLSVLLISGVHILQALQVIGETAGNTAVRDVVARASEHVQQGQQLSEHLGDGGVFPEMIVSMVAVGESAGAVDTMLEKIADFYEQHVEATTKKLSSLLEPILIVGIGSMLGALIVAMYLPIFDIFKLIK